MVITRWRESWSLTNDGSTATQCIWGWNTLVGDVLFTTTSGRSREGAQGTRPGPNFFIFKHFSEKNWSTSRLAPQLAPPRKSWNHHWERLWSNVLDFEMPDIQNSDANICTYCRSGSGFEWFEKVATWSGRVRFYHSRSNPIGRWMKLNKNWKNTRWDFTVFRIKIIKRLKSYEMNENAFQVPLFEEKWPKGNGKCWHGFSTSQNSIRWAQANVSIEWLAFPLRKRQREVRL